MKPIFSLALILTLMGCGGPGQDSSVIAFADDDEAMNAAVARARDTFDYFIDHWQDEGVNYSLKIAVPTDGGSIEHIWFNPTTIDGDDITAVCANNPKNVAGLQAGDVRSYTVEDVSDWMIVIDDRCYGGFTIQVAIEADPAAAAAVPYEFVDVD